MSLRYLWILVPLLSACSSLPKALTTREQPERTVREIFSWRVNRSGARVEDRRVLAVTPRHIDYEESGTRCRLHFKDVALVDQEFRAKNSDRLEAVRLFLEKDSESVNSTVVIDGPFSFGRSHIELSGRPQGTLARLRGALDKLKLNREDEDLKKAPEPAKEEELKKAPEGKKAAPPVNASLEKTKEREVKREDAKAVPKAPTKPAESSKSEALEEKLTKLKAWFDKGLITKEEYDQKRKSLLENY